VSDVNELLEILATRGKPRGAEKVLRDAIATVDDGHGDRDEAIPAGPARAVDRRDLQPLVPEAVDAPPAVNMRTVTPRRSRRPWRTALTAGGLAAMLGVVSLGVAALVGGGGSNSPEGAVRQLADAISHEDPLAAVDVLAPDEVRTLHDTVDAASLRAAEVELVNDAGAPFAGVDLDVTDLELSSVELAPGYAKVTLENGSIELGGDRSQLSARLQRVVPAIDQDAFDLQELHRFNFVVVVQRDGGWYISPAYTALEMVRVANDLPGADFGAGRATVASLGADSPEAAARGVLDAIAGADWNRLLELAPPGEIPAYDYRVGLVQLLNENVHPAFTVDQFDAQVETDGDTSYVDVTASGTVTPTAGDATGGPWRLNDGCLVTTYTSTNYENGQMVEQSYPDAFCLQAHGAYPFGWYGVANSSGPTRITTVQRDGRWFVSPVGSVLGYLNTWVRNADSRTVASLLHDPASLEPDGSITLGTPLTLEGDGSGLFYSYEFQGHGGQEIIAEVSEASNPDMGTPLYVLAPDGSFVEGGYASGNVLTATLPADGTNRIVVRAWSTNHLVLTVWDTADAPAAVRDRIANDDFASSSSKCASAPNGGTACSSASAGIESSTAPTSVP
jgi:hypothetical protein